MNRIKSLKPLTAKINGMSFLVLLSSRWLNKTQKKELVQKVTKDCSSFSVFSGDEAGASFIIKSMHQLPSRVYLTSNKKQIVFKANDGLIGVLDVTDIMNIGDHSAILDAEKLSYLKEVTSEYPIID